MCKFTPLGFETHLIDGAQAKPNACKFTPLGFETLNFQKHKILHQTCKFTPLGFETITARTKWVTIRCVNLPRWGLKQGDEE